MADTTTTDSINLTLFDFQNLQTGAASKDRAPRAVENLWIFREFLVEKTSDNFFLVQNVPEPTPLTCSPQLRTLLRLFSDRR
jgi:hypothetical protein